MPKIKRDYIAWPTIGLFVLSCLGTIFSVLLGCGCIIPYDVILKYMGINISIIYRLFVLIFNMFLCTMCSYAQFTVTHDAIHKSLSKNIYINDTIGAISHYWFGPTANWYGFKHNHLEHHKYTNISSLDPDYWSSLKGPGGPKLVGLRWITLDIPHWIAHTKYFANSKPIIRLKAILYQIPIILLIGFSIYYGFFGKILIHWILPARITLIILAYAFDFLPHYPHDTSTRDDRYKTTSYLSAPWYLKPFLSVIIFYQNYHVIHHLRPTIPFYKYKKFWTIEKNKLLNEKKIPVFRILPDIVGEEILSRSED